MNQKHKKIFKGVVLITFCMSIMLNLVLVVNWFSLEKMIEVNKSSSRISLILLPVKEDSLNGQGEDYEDSSSSESRKLKETNIIHSN